MYLKSVPWRKHKHDKHFFEVKKNFFFEKKQTQSLIRSKNCEMNNFLEILELRVF